jgi:hypothetical protein
MSDLPLISVLDVTEWLRLVAIGLGWVPHRALVG